MALLRGSVERGRLRVGKDSEAAEPQRKRDLRDLLVAIARTNGEPELQSWVLAGGVVRSATNPSAVW